MVFLFKKKKGDVKNVSSKKMGNRAAETTPATVASSSIMKSRRLHGGSYQDIEVLTPETKVAIQEREDLRKQLFSDSLEDDSFQSTPPSTPKTNTLARTATSRSMEVSPDGKITTVASFREDEDEKKEADETVAKNQPPSPGLVSVNSAVYRGPVSVDSPARVLTKAGQPFDESLEVLEEDIDENSDERNGASEQEISMEETTLQDFSVLTGMSTANSTFKPAAIAEQLMGTLKCGGPTSEGPQNVINTMRGTLEDLKKSRSVQKVMDMFYDRSPSRATSTATTKLQHRKRRPYYDETFTIRFIRRMTTKGAALLNLQAPGTVENDSLDWKGRTVTMLMEKGILTAPGSNGKKQQILPRLEWTTVAGGQSFDVVSNSVSLFDIVSITTTSQQHENSVEEEKSIDNPEEEEMCFFSVTTRNGDVYVFEANSMEERDSIVNGIKNVISRLAFHLVAGDATASSELYDFGSTKQATNIGDLPSLANPRQAMNRLAHVMLD